ncbi:MAG: sigma-70 family RNA polymerase sigma factor [Sphingobacteriaceae bacterium]|nr:MAG: sigma-70 family RNA polymerase sigma factor [Sphingobacteriaceae bacterium]
MNFNSFDSEKELLLEVAAGNEFAFRKLFNLHHQKLGTYIYRITENQELAEEVVQDVFLKIWLNRKALEKVQNFNAYLFTVSKNHALNCLRQQSKEWLQQKTWFTEQENLIENETGNYYKLLDKAIDRLPKQQQKIYLLSRHERLRYSEIAAKLNLSKETVKKYLKIANQSITSYLIAQHLLPVLLLVAINFL